MSRLTEVQVARTDRLDAYRQFDSPTASVDGLIRLARSVAGRLGSRKVWMMNSTATGGGVAEMMPQLCALLSELGVDTRWLVLEPDDPAFFRATKTLHNMIHGQPGSLGGDVASVYEQTSRAAAEKLRCLVNRNDVLVVHDPQPLGVARFLAPEHLPKLLWRVHIGVPHRNAATDEAWRFLTPYLEPYERLLFTSETYIQDALFSRSGVMTPSIDPLSHKNRHLHPYKLVGVLRVAGLTGGPTPPDWAKFKAPTTQFIDGRWVAAPLENLIYWPFVLQVSRFDRLKGFEYLIPAFVHMLGDYQDRIMRMRVNTERAAHELDRVQLVLAGPDPSGVSDDPEAQAVLEALCEQYQRLDVGLRQRIHILRLPMVDSRENALAVNALQRFAGVAVQNSLEEGFGLTVTEALWKATPMVASSVGGIALQVRPAIDGLLVSDPTDVCSLGETMLRMLAYSKEADAMARSAQTRVREHFLITTQLRRWLEELDLVLQKPHEVPAERAA